jgi:hypothetical protein
VGVPSFTEPFRALSWVAVVVFNSVEVATIVASDQFGHPRTSGIL